jgi:hypothetical protein
VKAKTEINMKKKLFFNMLTLIRVFSDYLAVFANTKIRKKYLKKFENYNKKKKCSM